ncbi:MAG TPA: glutaminyl-peptide cyclotransferase [Candidatus Tidjanibacter faecipullorum]|uniref:Glutaminyl-peptide cyclotransferase n=1 Tax=Candidatus Tidjanibacter faecipullorum TaxID=2838766 RepID=A0A9D2IKQ8_9BACT|nr:glutaminyl-peptide cyclotransferase [Candidatus Tidjanibacter faecipullorum]
MKRTFGLGLLAVALLASACGGRAARRGHAEASEADIRPQTAASVPSEAPVRYTYEVVAEYPHDTEAYTQGLYWKDGFFYEGTGGNGRSELRKVDPATGRVLQRTRLDRQYFGEGIALFGDRIYQLTWVTGKAYVYDAQNFRPVRTFVYDGEGWGLTTDGKYLYMSDGSERIAVRDPETFGIVRTFEVTSQGYPVDQLNELEWIDGLIWANRYLYDEVVMIDPRSGHVVGVIDFSDLQAPEDVLPQTDVFNGIAYDAETGAIYVTGKNWNKVYRVKIVKVA